MIQEIIKKIIELETIILAGIFDTSKIDIVADILRPEHFLKGKNQKVYKIVYDNFMENPDEWFPQTAIKIKKELNIQILKDYKNTKAITSSHLQFYSNELKKYHRKFKLLDLFSKSQNEINEKEIGDFVSDFNLSFTKIIDDSINKNDIKTSLDNFEKERIEYSEKIQNGNDIIGIPSGYKTLDRIIDGVRKGHIWVLGAYQGTGKTFFSLNMVASFIEKGKRVIFYSLEMSEVELISRLVGIMTEMNSMKIMKGFLNQEQKQKVDIALEKIRKSNLTICTDINNLERIKISMITETIKSKVDLFIIDYIQLVKTSKSSDYENMKEAVLELQPQIKKLKVPILILSQINNESAKNPNSRMMGFKGAGDIGAVADLGLEMDFDRDYYENDYNKYRKALNEEKHAYLKLYIKKNRHGIAGIVDIKFSGNCGKIEEYE